MRRVLKYVFLLAAAVLAQLVVSSADLHGAAMLGVYFGAAFVAVTVLSIAEVRATWKRPQRSGA